jgi:hypothetical protein
VRFLVDRGNLGKQTLREFQSFVTPDDGRKLSELYGVDYLQSSVIADGTSVVITTIQRLYSMLQDRELPEDLDEAPATAIEPDAPVNVEYSAAHPIEQFDVIVVDECHRSIYGVWRQVLELVSSIAARITRLDKRITKEDRAEVEAVAGASLSALTHLLVDAIDPDRHLAEANAATGSPGPSQHQRIRAGRTRDSPPAPRGAASDRGGGGAAALDPRQRQDHR